MFAALRSRTVHAYRAQPLRLSIAWLHASRNAFQEAAAPSVSEDNQWAALFSFGARIDAQLGTTLLKRCATHKSLSHEENNATLEFVGKRVASIVAVEHLHCKYPELHSQAFTDTLRSYLGNKSMFQVGTSVGLNHIMLWQPSEEPSTDGQTRQLGYSTALAECMNAVIGAVYLEHGHEVAKQFIHAHILSRDLNIRPIVKVDQPKRHVTMLLRKLNKAPAVSRLLSETGRLSNAPTYVVGVFSGEEKLGEGFGSSLRMAEYRACQDVLFAHYGKEQKDFTLPSDADKVDHYTPPVLGNTQAII